MMRRVANFTLDQIFANEFYSHLHIFCTSDLFIVVTHVIVVLDEHMTCLIALKTPKMWVTLQVDWMWDERGWFIDIQSNRWMPPRLHLKRHRITAPLLLGHYGDVDFIIDHLCSHHNHHQILIMCHTQSLYVATNRSVVNKLPSL